MNFIENAITVVTRSLATSRALRSLLRGLFILALPLLFAGCSGGDAPAAGTSGGEATITPTSEYEIVVSVSKNSILSNNLDTATIIATVSKRNVAQSGVTVTFTANGGILSSDTDVTDSSGQASATITSGLRPSNQAVDITATCLGATHTVQVAISGNTISLSAPQSNMAVGTTQTLTALLKNSLPLGIGWAPVTFSIVSGTSVSLSTTTANTNFNGEAAIDITGNSTGVTVIKAEALGTSAQITLTVATAAQVFEITSPTTDTTMDTVDGSIVVTVNAPTQAKVIFYTSIGVWNGGSNQLEVTVVGGVASATLTSTVAGNASVMVYDKANTDTKDTLQVSIYAPPSEAHHIVLQASQTSLLVTPDGSTSPNTVTLTAKVYSADNFAVGNAIVNFSLSNAPASGERVDPSVVVTNSAGVATTTFYSGTEGSSPLGVNVKATLSSNAAIKDDIDIVIRDLAGSIALTRANKVSPSADNTYYTQDITALVTDAGGHPVPENTPVSLKLWPTHYYLGAEAYDAEGTCVGYMTNSVPGNCSETAIPNEDINKNLILDLMPTSEDTGPYDMDLMVMAPDNYLTPPSAAGGSVPATAYTNAAGLASFKISYLKQYTMWIKTELTATVEVSGTESFAKMSWVLEPSKAEFDACDLFSSPFGYYSGACPP